MATLRLFQIDALADAVFSRSQLVAGRSNYGTSAQRSTTEPLANRILPREPFLRCVLMTFDSPTEMREFSSFLVTAVVRRRR